MGSFSWLKADDLTEIANIASDKPFKFLIPKEFGGGFIKDIYQDYGYLGTKDDGKKGYDPKYDMYELLAFWNNHLVDNDHLPLRNNRKPFGKGGLKWQGKYDGSTMPMMKEIDEFTDDNRSYGIDIGCYDEQIDRLKYPLKLVSCSFKGTYEDVGPSYGDPDQGFYQVRRIQNCRRYDY